jgi:Glycosyltransferase like family 2
MNVTVLIPTNRPTAAMIPCLQSLLMQSWPPVRVIIGDQSHSLLKDELLKHLCHKWDIEVVYTKAQSVQGNRNQLMKLVTTPHALLIDDDMVLEKDALDELEAATKKHKAGFVQVRIENIVPYEPQTAVGWRKHGTSGLVQQAAWADGGCVLVDVAAYRAVDTSYEALDGRGGEDIVWSAQIAARFGGLVAGGSLAWHLRVTPGAWQQRRPDGQWLRTNVKPRLSHDHWLRFVATLKSWMEWEHGYGIEG